MTGLAEAMKQAGWMRYGQGWMSSNGLRGEARIYVTNLAVRNHKGTQHVAVQAEVFGECGTVSMNWEVPGATAHLDINGLLQMAHIIVSGPGSSPDWGVLMATGRTPVAMLEEVIQLLSISQRP